MTKIEISLKTLLIVAALIILYKFILRIEYILILILFAYIITAAINPLVNFLQTKKIKRGLSIAMIYILVFVLIISFFLFIIIPLIRELVELFRQLPSIVDRFIQNTPLIQSSLGLDRHQVMHSLTQLSNAISKSLLDVNTGLTTVYRTALGLIQFIASVLSIIVMSIYMLLDREMNNRFIAGLIPEKYRERALHIQDKVEDKLGRWLQAQFILSFIIFLLNYIALSILHIKFALTIALIAGFLEVVPVAGPVIAGVIAFTFALLFNPGNSLYVLAASVLIHQLEGHVLTPKIMQKVIGLSPLVTIIALLIGAELVGVVGAVLSVPIAATLQIFYLELQKND